MVFDSEDEDKEKQFEDSFQRNYINETEEDDSLTTYREIFTQTEEERFEEEEKQKLIKTNIITNTHLNDKVYKLDWTLQEDLVMFNIGELVVKRNKLFVYKVVNFGKDVNTYIVRLSNTETDSVFNGAELKKAPKGSTWEKLIVDPYKRWLKEQEEKKQAKN